MKQSIKTPIPEIFETYEILSNAVDAHISGDFANAERLFEEANSQIVWNWTNPHWEKVHLNVVSKHPEGDIPSVPRVTRDPIRGVPQAIKSLVLQRDGHRCRYCGIPVIDKGIWDVARTLYPAAVAYTPSDPRSQHAGFQCMWLQYDHVVPHSRGGRSDQANVVVTCALCNFGKWDFTLRQLDIADPRLRPPESAAWDGLERLRRFAIRPKPKPVSKGPDAGVGKVSTVLNQPHVNEVGERAFFLPGAWVSAGYLFTPPIDGKERWFKLARGLLAEPVLRGDISGYRVVCDPSVLLRRGISIEPLLDILSAGLSCSEP